MKRTLLVLFLAFLVATSFAQDRKYSQLVNPVREDGANMLNYVVKINPINLMSPLAYPGEIPGTSTFWDYQTNGSSLNSLMIFGDTLLFCYPGVDSTDPTGASTRLAYLVVSVDGGVTWQSPLPLTSLPNRSGYPEVRKVYLTGGITSTVISGRRYNGSTSSGGAFVDAFFGLGSFSTSFVPNGGRDLFGDLLGSGIYGGTYSNVETSSTDSLFFVKYNYNTNTMSGKTSIAIPPNGISGNVRYRFASNGNNNAIIVWYDNAAAAYSLRFKATTDGGSTWGSTTSFQTAFGLNGVVNGDTCSPWFGIDAAFKPGTTSWGTVWSTLYPTSTGQSSGDPQGCKILFSKDGGAPVEVAGKINMNIISNQTLFENRAALQVGVTPLSHPSIAFSSDGSRIVVAFSAFQPGDSLDNFEYNDIYVTYSDNGGTTWATPVNLTNTSTWDELYPVLSETGNTPGQFTIKYQVTKGPGSQSFTDAAPTYRVYHVMKRFNPANVGIKEVNGIVPNKYSLNQNYPNPFNPSTTIRFDIPKSSFVTLKVYDITGKVVDVLVNENLKAGAKEVSFDASRLSSGVYFYKITADGFQATKKMILVK